MSETARERPQPFNLSLIQSPGLDFRFQLGCIVHIAILRSSFQYDLRKTGSAVSNSGVHRGRLHWDRDRKKPCCTRTWSVTMFFVNAPIIEFWRVLVFALTVQDVPTQSKQAPGPCSYIC